ncbi:hypothetical protein [Taibaiella sp. KBW10]|uniref:hypothetical protein n=1 Tax=Taibaiella sp. KBW10 TaxID=2153357 RepID=UPI000F5993C3|nr:hypothetical protein [Taibaiella sp. KBW10]
MKKIQIILLCLSGVIGMIFIACKKYVDPTKPDITLTNHYCNDPIAANYNHGFPGIPDNSVCRYPTDFFKGNWQFVDSIFYPDMRFYRTQTLSLSFTPMDQALDTFRTRLTVLGLCPNNTILKVTANKYALALTDTLLPNVNGGQLFCSVSDTVSGFFKRTNDTLRTSMNINLTELSAADTFYHRGLAIKQ